MRESDFIKELKKERQLKNMDIAKRKINIFWETLIEILQQEGEKIVFKGWGSFGVKKTNERIFNNPRTKKTEKLPSIKKIVFKQGKKLKERFNSKGEE